jgi:hypothetical protein
MSNTDTDNVVELQTTEQPKPAPAAPQTIQVPGDKECTIVLNFIQITTVLAGLGKIPAEESYDIINLIRNQVVQQNMPVPTE